MEKIELELEEEVMERARARAAARHSTLEELLKEFVEHLGSTTMTADPLLGMISDEPALIDQVTDMALQARNDHPLRNSGGSGSA